jgi:hypothetical protein
MTEDWPVAVRRATRGMACLVWPFADGCQPLVLPASLSTRGVPRGPIVPSTPEGRLAPLRGRRA